MAKSSIASAYVQVIPTTEGIKDSLVKGMQPEASKAGDESGKSAGEGFAKKMLGAIAAVGIGKKIGDVIKGAVDIGGALEQSIGGIQALYGENIAGYMVRQANDAFKTVGISANEYMEQVTGFSAALINSVGGDTGKAAKLANQAMIDMGDNVNRFGTDMESVQNAISGLSRGNFTMLDNLKLGFAGNKQGMIDLINQSGVLEEKITDLDGIGFDTMLEAIHEVQTQLNVSGTTAKEAESTLQGSFAAMSAAWSNLQGAMATGEGVGKAVQDMVATIPTYLGNLVPMIKNVISGIGSAIGPMVMQLGSMLLDQLKGVNFAEAAKGIADSITTAIQGDGFGQFLAMGNEIITALVNGIATALPIITPAIVQLLSYITTSIIDNLPALLSAGMSLLQGLADGLIAALPTLIQQLPVIIESVVNYMTTAGPMLWQKGADLLLSLANGIVEAMPQLVAQLPRIIQTIITFITKNLPKLVSQGMKILTSLIQGLARAIPQLVAYVPVIIRTILSGLISNAPQLASAGASMIGSILSGLRSMIGSVAGIGAEIVRGIWSGISNMAGWLKSLISGFVGNVTGWLKSMFKIGSPSKLMADEIGRWIPPGIAVGITANADAVTDAMDSLRADAIAGFDSNLGLTYNYAHNMQPATPQSMNPINITIYAREGQSVNDLYNVFERRLTQAVLRKEASYA